MADFIDGKWKNFTSKERKKIQHAFGMTGYKTFLEWNKHGMFQKYDLTNPVNLYLIKICLKYGKTPDALTSQYSGKQLFNKIKK